MFWILGFHQIYDLQVFPPILQVGFTFSIVSSGAQRFKICVTFDLSVFSFVTCAFGLLSKNL